MCNIEDFDAIYLSGCDPIGVGRGRFVFRSAYPSILKNGLGVAQVAFFCGVSYEICLLFKDLKDKGWRNGSFVPDMRTLKPLPWIGVKGSKIGHIICDLYDAEGDIEEAMPRALAAKQLAHLKELGYEMVIEQELEFHVCEKGTNTPVSNDLSAVIDNLRTKLKECNLAVCDVTQGPKPHILRVSMSGVEAMEAASNNHSVRYAIKSICAYQGYSVTFMTKPFADSDPSGNTLRYWLRCSDTGRCAFYDEASKETSKTAILWTNGQRQYANGIYCFLRPTVNCYWASQDKMSLCLESRNVGEDNNNQGTPSGQSQVIVVDKRPSSVNNPYNTLAAIVAAGIAGLNSSHDTQSEAQSDPPTTLKEAMDNLASSPFLTDRLGQLFVHRYSTLKREYEVLKFDNNAKENPDADVYSFSRTVYFHL